MSLESYMQLKSVSCDYSEMIVACKSDTAWQRGYHADLLIKYIIILQCKGIVSRRSWRDAIRSNIRRVERSQHKGSPTNTSEDPPA